MTQKTELEEIISNNNVRLSVILIISAVASKELGHDKGYKITLELLKQESKRLEDADKIR